MADRWATRDLPVLTWLEERLDPIDAAAVQAGDVATGLSMYERDVQAALRNLASATPPLIEGVTAAQANYPVLVIAVTDEGRRRCGAWPTADGLADSLLRALERRAEAETDPEKKSRLRGVVAGFAGAGRDVLVDVTAAVVTGRIPL